MKFKNNLNSLKNINKKSLEDSIKLLKQLDTSLYRKKLKIIDNSSISMHFRHIYDFWNCFYEGLKLSKINYNNRLRDTVLENNKNEMEIAFNEIILNIDKIASQELILIDDLIEPSNQINIKTNIIRELIFLYEHTTHHIYIIRMVMNSLNIKIEDNYIGYNLSTIKKIKCV